MPHYDGSLLTTLFPLLNPFALLAGLISVSMLTVHGAVWLQLRTSGDIADRARKVVTCLAPFTALAFAGAGLWVTWGIKGFRIVTQPDHNAAPDPLGKSVETATGAWLDIYHTHPAAMLAPVLGIACALLTPALSRARRPGGAFIASALSIAGIISTAGLSMFPFVMPSRTVPNSGLTLWDAVSSPFSLTVMFWAVVLLLPIVLAYTVWCYVRMWGKVTADDIRTNAHSVY
jgi:cytochrome d ubiquinol oxidase subunit II